MPQSTVEKMRERQERMQAVGDSVGPVLSDAIAEITRDAVDGYLSGARMPKEYAELRGFAHLLSDTIFCWAVSEGYVGPVRKKFIVTAEELAEREARAAERQVMADTMRSLMGDGGPGGYI